MNNDLISREDLKELLKECAYSYDGVNTWIMKDEVLGIIDNAPTVPLPDFKEGYKQAILDGKTNFSRQKGEWINHRNDFGHNIADCSECGKTMQWHDEDEDGIPRYCWFCGAEMKEPYKKSGTENEDLEARARWICCPMCDRETCNRRADDCDVKIWLEKHKEDSND